MTRLVSGLALPGAVAAIVGGSVGAAEAAQPTPWAMWLQEPASPIMEMINRFNTGIVIAMVAIVLLVLALLIYVMVRFNAKANPVPSKTSHNTTVEVVWTVAPILILIAIAVPSFSIPSRSSRSTSSMGTGTIAVGPSCAGRTAWST
ncbi:MAG: hypothetical protein J0H54_04760, partial [Rhizobiales bacterium]|nr:hypothetical protein [Hyphomicrobiales bacterium]